jgi:hypothetical protein
MKKILKWAAILLIVVLIIMQFFRIDKTVPEYDKNLDIITVTNAPDEVAGILKTACYDCHSYETHYPWYSNVAPVSWFLQNHINEAREELNFSLWGSFSAKRLSKKIEEAIEEIEEGEMPMKSYTITHASAKLSKEEREKLIQFFKRL